MYLYNRDTSNSPGVTFHYSHKVEKEKEREPERRYYHVTTWMVSMVLDHSMFKTKLNEVSLYIPTITVVLTARGYLATAKLSNIQTKKNYIQPQQFS